MNQFHLPNTKMSVVVWYRSGKRNEVLIATPPTNNRLKDVMFTGHKVGFSEIRAVKAVETGELLFQRI